MKLAHRSLLPALALTLLLGGASAQSIDSVTGDGPDPSMGSLGTTLTITGTGLGGPTGLGKPGAFLQDPLTLKKFALQVLTFSDTEITALIKKAAYGSLDVLVQPKGGALLTATGAFTVPDPEITGILPPDQAGTIGTPVTISGSGLLGVVGLSKPKVLLFDASTGKKYSLKVLTYSNSEVTAVISKAVAGTLELQLIPKGGTALVASAAFEVPLPNVSLVTPGFAYAGAIVTLDCEHVGTKKPKVKLGKKSCKVLTYSDTVVTFLMPKKLPKGVQTLQLINKVGTATMIGAIINQGDVPDTATDDVMTAKAGKIKFVAGGGLFFDLVSTFDDGPPPVLTTNGFQVDPVTFVTQFGMTLFTPFDPATFTDPVAFIDAPDGKLEFQIPPTTLFGDPVALWTSDAPGGSYSITILDVDPVLVDQTPGYLVRGAFTGTLILVEGTGDATLLVTNGEFRSTFAPAP